MKSILKKCLKHGLIKEEKELFDYCSNVLLGYNIKNQAPDSHVDTLNYHIDKIIAKVKNVVEEESEDTADESKDEPEVDEPKVDEPKVDEPKVETKNTGSVLNKANRNQFRNKR